MFHRFMENNFVTNLTPPGTLSAGTTSYVDMGQWERGVFLIEVGSNNNNVGATVVQATSSSGTGVKNVTVTDSNNNVLSTAQLPASAITTTISNKYAVIEVADRNLDIVNGFRYVALTTTLAGGTSTTGSIKFIGLEPRHSGNTNDGGFVQGADNAAIVYFDQLNGSY